MKTGGAFAALRRLLEGERSRPAADRSSRATDEQLDLALAEVARAEASGGASTAEADRLAQLVHVVSDSWPFSSVGAEVMAHLQTLRRTRDRPRQQDLVGSDVGDLLDTSPSEDDSRRRAWLADVDESLGGQPEAWTRAVEALLREGGPGRDRAWVLLSWVEDAASLIVSERRNDLVERAAFAMSLLEASPLDRRDVMLVAMLVRRASSLAGLDYLPLVRAGCDRAGPSGASCEAWLSRITEALPSTHEEVGTGRAVAFRRRPHDIDVARLEQRFRRPD